MSTRAKWIVALALAIIVGLALASVLRLRAVQMVEGAELRSAAGGGTVLAAIPNSNHGPLHA